MAEYHMLTIWRIEHKVAIEGVATGDLDGSGRWKFSSPGKLSVVNFEWQVHSKRWWMNPVALAVKAGVGQIAAPARSRAGRL